MLTGSHQSVCTIGPLPSRLHHTRSLAVAAPIRGAIHRRTIIRTEQKRLQPVRADADDKAGEGQTSTAVEPGKVLGREGDTTPSATDVEQPEVSVATSEEDIKTLKAALQKQREGAQDVGLVEGILEEVRLISWPNPLQALSDTFVVIAIVAGTAVSLFAVNTVLSDISKQLY